MSDIIAKNPEIKSKSIDFKKVVIRLGSPYYQLKTQESLFKNGFTWEDGTKELRRDFDYPEAGKRFLYEVILNLETKIITPYFKKNENSELSLVTLDVNQFAAGKLLEKIIKKKTFKKDDVKDGYRPVGLVDDEPIIHPFSFDQISKGGEDDEEVGMFDKLWQDLLQVSVKHMKHLLEHPKELAYIYWKYDRLLNACRYVGQGFENPKYPIIEIEENAVSEHGEKYDGVVYDAWGFSVSNEGFPLDDDDVTDERVTNPLYEIQSKPNKTMYDWIKLKTDKSYQYNSLYPNLWSVLNYLFCVIGTGYGWNKEGFIVEEGSSDTDNSIFSNALFEGRPTGELKKDLDVIFESELYQKLVEFKKSHYVRYRQMKRVEKEASEDTSDLVKRIKEQMKAAQDKVDAGEILSVDENKMLEAFKDLFGEVEKEEEKQNNFYPLSEYSLLVKMPKNAHESYIKYGTDVAYDILKNPNEEKNNKREALKFLTKFGKDTPLKYKLVNAYSKGTPSAIGDDVIVNSDNVFYICKVDTDESEYCKPYSDNTETGVGLKTPASAPFYIIMKHELKKLVAVDLVGDSKDVPKTEWKSILKVMQSDLEVAEKVKAKNNTNGVRRLTSKESRDFSFTKCEKLTKKEMTDILTILTEQAPKGGHIQKEGLSGMTDGNVQYGDIKLNCAFSYIARRKAAINKNLPHSDHSGLFLDSIRIFKGKDKKLYIEFSEDSARKDETFMLVAQTMDGLKALQKTMLNLNF